MDWVDSLIACSINTYMMIWSDFEFVIHLACIIKTHIFDIIWPCLSIIMIMTWLFLGILFICALVTYKRAQINNISSKSYVIPLLSYKNCSCGDGAGNPAPLLLQKNFKPKETMHVSKQICSKFVFKKCFCQDNWILKSLIFTFKFRWRLHLE